MFQIGITILAIILGSGVALPVGMLVSLRCGVAAGVICYTIAVLAIMILVAVLLSYKRDA